MEFGPIEPEFEVQAISPERQIRCALSQVNKVKYDSQKGFLHNRALIFFLLISTLR